MSTDMQRESTLTTAESSLPSPLKSPTAKDPGWNPAGNTRAAAKLGAGQPSAIVGLLWNRPLNRATNAATVGSDTGPFTSTVRDGQQTPFPPMLLLSGCKGLTNSSRPPEDRSDNGGNTLFFKAKDPKARQHRLRRAVIGLDFLALLPFSPSSSSSGEVTESQGFATSTFFRRYAAPNSVNT